MQIPRLADVRSLASAGEEWVKTVARLVLGKAKDAGGLAFALEQGVCRRELFLDIQVVETQLEASC